MHIQIWFDGGCKPNPGMMYGSYCIWVDGSEICKCTEDYEYGTSNVAEFSALYHALCRTFRVLESLNKDSSKCSIELFTDSTIVKNRLVRPDRPMKAKHRATEGYKRMTQWTESCMRKLNQFNHYNVNWNSREVNLMKFGH